MRKHILMPIGLLLVITLLTSLACNLLPGRNNLDESMTEMENLLESSVTEVAAAGEQAAELAQEAQEELVPTLLAEVPADVNSGSPDTEFPLPKDVQNFLDTGNGGINFQTSMTMDEAVEFYKEAFTEKGLTEREILTSFSETTVSMVFDGDPSGKAVVFQIVDLGNGTINISLRYEDV